MPSNLHYELWIALARYIAQHEGELALRRATSTAYFAMLHALSETAANLFIGTAGSPLSQYAWYQVYRALEHGRVRDACERDMLQGFPPEIREFGRLFVIMQKKRQAADYDPYAHFKQSHVMFDIDNVEQVIRAFNTASEKDRRAFAAFVLFKIRPISTPAP